MKQLLFLFIALLGSSLISAPTLYRLDLKILSTEASLARVSLTTGKALQFQTAFEPGMQILFEDLYPGANWAHPVRYKLVDKAGVIKETIEDRFPPSDWSQATLVSGEDSRVSTNIEFKIKSLEGKYRVANQDRYYAIFINGQADKRHWNDFSFLYRVLTQVYGYSPKNIFIADSNFQTAAPDLDGNGTNDIQYASDVAGVTTLLKDAKDKVSANDHLLLAINDHGDLKEGQATLVLKDRDMKVAEFAPLFSEIKAKTVLSIFEQCYSGGFVRPVVARDRVAMAAATNSEFSWASMDLNFNEFIYHVISAFAHQRHDGTPVESDLNRDNFVSAQEAFAFAAAKDQRAESPFLESFNNSAGSVSIGVVSKNVK
jgi:hypothetical protein